MRDSVALRSNPYNANSSSLRIDSRIQHVGNQLWLTAATVPYTCRSLRYIIQSLLHEGM